MNAQFKLSGLEISTPRLLLRPFRESDLKDFHEYASVEGVGEMAGWNHHRNMDETREILYKFIKSDNVFAVTYRESGKVIGSLGVEKYGNEEKLTEFSGLQGREIGYVLSRDYWGQGLMPEAVTGVMEYLFKEMNLDFLTCGYFLSNKQSRRVQEKCGFRPYRKIFVETQFGTREETVLNLLLNPDKDITLEFSHPETLIWGKW